MFVCVILLVLKLSFFPIILFLLQIEKTKIEEKKKLEEQELLRTKQEKIHSDIENSTLKHELEIAKTTHEEHYLLLQVQAEETKVELEKKLKELECFLAESKKRVKELESFSESKSQRWKSKEGSYRSFIDYQSRALKVCLTLLFLSELLLMLSQ